MKLTLLFIAFIVCLSGFAQRNIDSELLLQTPNCENVAFNSSRLIDRYFVKKNYDSINIVCNRWEDFCGTTEPLFRLKVLQQVQSKTFSEEWMNNELLMNFVFLYLDRLDYSKEPNAKLIYERYKISFGYISFNLPFDDLTIIWANSLLENIDLKPIERAFCLLYSNQTDAFWQMLKDKKLLGTKLQDVYEEQVRKTKRMVEGNLGLLSGVMLPFGNLSEYIGIKPAFGFQLGFKSNRIQYDLTFLIRAGKAVKDYQIIYLNEPKMTNQCVGGYIGLDFAYELSRNKRHEFDFLSGFGYDGFSAIEGDAKNGIDGKSINSLNLNLGFGYRFYTRKMNFYGIQTKYNFANYSNDGGTDLGGNYISLILTANMFGNIQKNHMKERLKMK